MSTSDSAPRDRPTFLPRHRETARTAVLLLTCPDTRGIVAAVAQWLYTHGANIVEVDQHSDSTAGLFFQRVEFELDGFDLPDAEVLPAFREQVGDRFAMECDVRFPEQVPRIAVLASRQPHCLLDLLARWRTGELAADIALVASNHPDHEDACAFFGVPYAYLPVGAEGRPAQEDRLMQAIAASGAELVVLARYMQVLSDRFCARYPHAVINIHHSLLPAFSGAKPYHRAFERGVKIIGATAHYATADLDQGPIIAQDVARVTHRDSVDDLVARGRDLEAHVLARAVRLHLAAKVLVHGTRTVVFE